MVLFAPTFDEETYALIVSAWEALFACGDFVKFEEFADVPKRFYWHMDVEYQVREDIDQLLPCMSELMDLFDTPVESRSFRQNYDRNYRRKFPNDNERFLNRDVLDAGIRNVGCTMVNGVSYEINKINNRSLDAGRRLSKIFRTMSRAFANLNNIVPDVRQSESFDYWNAIFIEFDQAYAQYEHMHTLVLIHIEGHIRQPLFIARARYEQIMRNFCADETARLVEELSLITRTINAGPGFIVTMPLWERANKIIKESKGPVRDLAQAALDSYVSFAQYLCSADIDSLDTCLYRNNELSDVANAYAKAFETFDKFSSEQFLTGLAAVLETLNEIKTVFPEFALAVGSYDSEAMLRLPCVMLATAFANPTLIPFLTSFLPEQDFICLKENVTGARADCPATSLEMSTILLHLECPQLLPKASEHVNITNEKLLAVAAFLRPLNMIIQRHHAGMYNEFLMVLLGSFDDGSEDEGVDVQPAATAAAAATGDATSSAGCSVDGRDVEMADSKFIGSQF